MTMMILKMLTGVFAFAAGAFGRWRVAPCLPTRPRGRSLDEALAVNRRQAAYCKLSAAPDKLRHAAAWHRKVAAKCCEAGDESGRREHSAHAERYSAAFRFLSEERDTAIIKERAAIVARVEREAYATRPVPDLQVPLRVRVQCPRCSAREEYEILVPPEQFRYRCRDRGCTGSEELWSWNRSFCEVVQSQSQDCAQTLAVSHVNVVDPDEQASAARLAETTKVRVQCPTCGAREEHEITVAPEKFRYICLNSGGCAAAIQKSVRSWNKTLCEVVQSVPNDDKIWVTGKGERIRPADMGNGHLVNTIKYLERKARAARQIRAAHRPRGRGYAPLEDFIGKRLPVYEEMLRVADKRGLKYE